MRKIEKILDRLYNVLKIKNDTEFANKYDIKRNTISTWKKRDSVPYKLLELISQNENLSLDWLLTGKGSIYLNDSNTQNTNCTNNTCYNIEKLSLQASAGSGIQNYEVNTLQTIQLPKALFKTPQNENNLKIIQVQGDSMEPTIKDNAFIVIDTTKTDLIDGGIYAILLDDQILIKRLQKTPGQIKIISDNKNYETIYYNPKEQQDINFKIIGKKILQIQQ